MQVPGIFHCVVRGDHREPIFVTERDKHDFLRMLMDNRQAMQFQILAFALLDNQTHMLLKLGQNPLAELMAAQLSTYARTFNRHHNRSGHVFQERYQARRCYEDERLLLVVRHMHQLPVLYGHSQHVNLARWTSHLAYLGDERLGLVDREIVLGIIGKSHPGPIRAYQSLMSQPVPDSELGRAYMPEEQVAEERAVIFPAATMPGLDDVAKFVESETGVRLEVMRSKSRNERVVKARRMFIAATVLLLSLPVSEVARFLNVHHSYVSRLTFPGNEATPELELAAKEMSAALGVEYIETRR
jgi:REP element-mobilizing transposase RayT